MKSEYINISLNMGITVGRMKIKRENYGTDLNIPALLDNGAFVFVFKVRRGIKYILSEVRKA